MISIAKCTNSVSYTHLDVYKRQGYNSSLIDNLLRKQKHKLSKPRIEKDTKTIFISTTYTNIMPKILTSVLNNNNRTVIFKTNNNLVNILCNKITIPLEKKTGVYKLSCDDCECFYIGQTGRGFQKRFIEHTPCLLYTSSFEFRVDGIIL